MWNRDRYLRLGIVLLLGIRFTIQGKSDLSVHHFHASRAVASRGSSPTGCERGALRLLTI